MYLLHNDYKISWVGKISTKMIADKELLKEVVTELVGSEAVDVAMYLRGKTKISEFIIAEELELEIHRTRFLLYKLLEHNVVTFVRKKDKIKGWYICYWDLKSNMLNQLKEKIDKEKIDKLLERLKREQENQFYLCKNACTRTDFDQAIQQNFKCPECGQLMALQDNQRTIEFLKQRIKELQKNKGEA